MSILAKIRGLYRWDGDSDPLVVSRRRFIFLGTVAAAGALLPIPVGPGQPVTTCTGALPYSWRVGSAHGLQRAVYPPVITVRGEYLYRLQRHRELFGGTQWPATDMAAEAGKRGWA